MTPILLSKADVGEVEERSVIDAMRSGWIAPLGPRVDAFEAEMAGCVDIAEALALSAESVAGSWGAHLRDQARDSPGCSSQRAGSQGPSAALRPPQGEQDARFLVITVRNSEGALATITTISTPTR